MELMSKNNECHDMKAHMDSANQRTKVLQDQYETSRQRIDTLQQQQAQSPSISMYVTISCVHLWIRLCV
jgi:chaperonin cofactor prefoldin